MLPAQVAASAGRGISATVGGLQNPFDGMHLQNPGISVDTEEGIGAKRGIIAGGQSLVGQHRNAVGQFFDDAGKAMQPLADTGASISNTLGNLQNPLEGMYLQAPGLKIDTDSGEVAFKRSIVGGGQPLVGEQRNVLGDFFDGLGLIKPRN